VVAAGTPDGSGFPLEGEQGFFFLDEAGYRLACGDPGKANVDDGSPAF